MDSEFLHGVAGFTINFCCAHDHTWEFRQDHAWVVAVAVGSVAEVDDEMGKKDTFREIKKSDRNGDTRNAVDWIKMSVVMF